VTAAAGRRRPRSLAVERFGVEPIPPELRTVRWRELLAVILTFNLSPFMYVVGAVVVGGGLPLWWAAGAVALGSAASASLLVVVAQIGVDYGVAAQVGLRATFGQWGARLVTSPYRLGVAPYWAAAQSFAAAFALEATLRALFGIDAPLVPMALGLTVVQVALAVLGFDMLRYVARVMLPLIALLAAVLVVLYLTADEPAYAVGRVFASPEQRFTWTGFATFVTVVAGIQLSFVTNIADFCRYARSRRDVRIGYPLGVVGGSTIAAWIGGYAAVATGSLNPFVAVVDLHSAAPLLVLVGVGVALQASAVNVMTIYSGGLALVNAVPPLGRARATLGLGGLAVALAAFPDVVESAERWMTHIGSVGAPFAAVVFVDYVAVKRRRIDVPALFAPRGRYRYLGGVNPAALVAIAAGLGTYQAVPHEWIKVAWGVAAAALVYLGLVPLQSAA
jgi:NCS1 family nucleobase:cation symporter-1